MKIAKLTTGMTVTSILLSKSVLAAYNATYNKADARIVLFDVTWGAFSWIIGVFGFVILIWLLVLGLRYWVRKKME